MKDGVPLNPVWTEKVIVGKRQKIPNCGGSNNLPKTGAVPKRNFKSPIKVVRDESV